MKSYSATYEPQIVYGEAGYWYRCYVGGRLIFEGWSKGKKRDAEDEVRNGIDAREALRSAVRS